MKLNHFTNVLRSLSKLTNNQIHVIQHRINNEINKGGTNLLIDKCKGGDIFALIVEVRALVSGRLLVGCSVTDARPNPVTKHLML
jgi:hypothetical protein